MLVASITANVVLWYQRVAILPVAPLPPVAKMPAPPRLPAPPAPPEYPIMAIAVALGRAGYPRDVIDAAVMTAIQLKWRHKIGEAMGAYRMRRWNRSITSLVSGDRELAAIAKNKELELAQIAEELGRALPLPINPTPLARAPGTFDPETRAKIDAFKREVQTARETMPSDATYFDRFKVEQEFEAALAAELTPAQFVEYSRYETTAAQFVQRWLSRFDLAESTYNQIIDAELRFTREYPYGGRDETQRLIARVDTVSVYRSALGDSDFVTIMDQLDPTYASFVDATAAIGLTTSQRIDLFIALVKTPKDFLVGDPTAAASASRVIDLISRGLTDEQWAILATNASVQKLIRAGGVRTKK